MPMNVNAYLAARRRAVDRYLDTVLPPADTAPAPLSAAVRYAVFSGGKRIRPILLLHVYQLCGGTGRRAFPAAAAVEMVHAFSLVQDDLPAMDNDDFRRGKPTLHRASGEPTALLASDYLLVRALQLLAERCPPPALAIMTRGIGFTGLLGGQYLDLAWQGRPTPPDVLESIRLQKTAALFEVVFELAGLIAGCPARRRTRLGEYGRLFGLAFQVRDDLKDAETAETAERMRERLAGLVAVLGNHEAKAGLASPVFTHFRDFLGRC